MTSVLIRCSDWLGRNKIEKQLTKTEMTKQTNGGGPAFPDNNPEHPSDQRSGMTMRDYFAGQALAGIMARGTGTSNALEWAPEEAYAVADAMLSARGA